MQNRNHINLAVGSTDKSAFDEESVEHHVEQFMRRIGIALHQIAEVPPSRTATQEVEKVQDVDTIVLGPAECRVITAPISRAPERQSQMQVWRALSTHATRTAVDKHSHARSKRLAVHCAFATMTSVVVAGAWLVFLAERIW
jgi:hypothetical protein